MVDFSGTSLGLGSDDGHGHDIELRLRLQLGGHDDYLSDVLALGGGGQLQDTSTAGANAGVDLELRLQLGGHEVDEQSATAMVATIVHPLAQSVTFGTSGVGPVAVDGSEKRRSKQPTSLQHHGISRGDSGSRIRSNGTSDNLINATASMTCSYCRHELHCNLNLAGFPAGVKFNPSDQELIEHLESMVLLLKEGGGSRAHAPVNHFIPTIEGDIGICYTHPENLPGVTRDGFSKHFFHRTSKAFQTGTRKRRKIVLEHGEHNSEDAWEAHWHKIGQTIPVIVGGRQKGCRKILVLRNVKRGKYEKTNWVIHQYHLGISYEEYHLGISDEEKVGELVLSKVFYRHPDATMIEQNDEKVEVTSEATPNILPVFDAAAVTMVQMQQASTAEAGLMVTTSKDVSRGWYSLGIRYTQTCKK